MCGIYVGFGEFRHYLLEEERIFLRLSRFAGEPMPHGSARSQLSWIVGAVNCGYGAIIDLRNFHEVRIGGEPKRDEDSWRCNETSLLVDGRFYLIPKKLEKNLCVVLEELSSDGGKNSDCRQKIEEAR